MKFSWKWLNQLIVLDNISLNYIINKLTLAGFEIEEIKNKPSIKDKTITINITINRADVSCMIGLAREICTILNIEFVHNNKAIYTNYFHNSQSIKNSSKNDINLISSSLLEVKINLLTNLQQATSPKWLINYLKGCDITPSNIISDILEYINIKWGQDIEFFDTNKIISHKVDGSLIKIENININEKITQIFNSFPLNLNTSLEMLKYQETILSIIGFQSNPQLACDINTSSIIIVGQICDPNYIERTTQKLKSKTEKSNKHIKSISKNDFINAYNEAIELILYLTEGKLDKLCKYQNFNNNQKNKKIEIHKTAIDNILGPCNKKNNKCLDENGIIEILQQLKFKPKYQNNTFTVTIPEHRKDDIKRSIDVIEEIGRIHGFDQFIDKIPQYNKRGNISKSIKLIKKIRYILRNLGLHEVIHYSLEDQSQQDSKYIKLYNPLLTDQSQLRTNLIKNLIKTKKYNLKQDNSFIECFEIGRVFHQEQQDKNHSKHLEYINLAGVMGKTNFSRTLWSEKAKDLSWFQAKGILEEFFEKLHANVYWTQKNNLIKNNDWKKIIHPYRTAIIQNEITKENIGIFSQLNAKYINESENNHATYIFELNIMNLMKTINNNKHLSYIFKPYSNYPSVTRDISLKLNSNETAESIKGQILSQKNCLIESVEIFNEYKNTNIRINNRNVGFRITYRSNDRTLNDQDLKNIEQGIKNLLNNK